MYISRKKNILVLLILFTSCTFIFANNKNYNFFATLGPSILVNTDDSTKSAPSPVLFTVGVGADLLTNKIISIQPKISLFTNYYLWDGESPRPAEVENRTALVISSLIDLDIFHSFKFSKNEVQIGGGIGILARYGVLAFGVAKDDKGGTSEQNAGEDVKSINNWFFKDLNYLYPNIMFSYTRTLNSGWKAGIESKLYFPLGSLMNNNNFDSAIISFGLKLCAK